MNRKTFKFENKNKKKIRVRDILMILSIFTLCLITVISTSDFSSENKKTSGVTEITEKNVDSSNQQLQSVEYKESNNAPISATQISNQPVQKYDFISPVDGAVIKPFSKSELVYSRTMDDWRTHLGVDIACPYGTDVISSERGEVKNIEYNVNFGNSVTVESGEYTIIYTSLSSDIFVNIGDKISKGDMIGKTAESCISEICDEPHMHFEVIKNSEHIDPMEIIKFK